MEEIIFPNHIRMYRRLRGRSMQELADHLAVSLSAISKIEKGERNVSLEILSKIAWSLGVNVEFLIKKNPFKPSNIYIDKLITELKELDSIRQKEICASIIEKLWLEYEEKERAERK